MTVPPPAILAHADDVRQPRRARRAQLREHRERALLRDDVGSHAVLAAGEV